MNVAPFSHLKPLGMVTPVNGYKSRKSQDDVFSHKFSCFWVKKMVNIQKQGLQKRLPVERDAEASGGQRYM